MASQQRLALALHRRQRARPDLVQQALHGAARAGHGVGQRVVGIAGVAVQRGLLVAQAQDGARHLAGCRARRRARRGRPRRARPARAGRAAAEKLRKGTTSERDSVITWPSQAALGRGLARRGAHEAGQAGQVGLAAQHQLPGRLRRAARSARSCVVSSRQLLHHLRIARLRAPARRRAPARTKSRCMRSSSRRCSGVRPSASRRACSASMRANSAASM